jgi:hypothetical protein
MSTATWTSAKKKTDYFNHVERAEPEFRFLSEEEIGRLWNAAPSLDSIERICTGMRWANWAKELIEKQIETIQKQKDSIKKMQDEHVQYHLTNNLASELLKIGQKVWLSGHTNVQATILEANYLSTSIGSVAEYRVTWWEGNRLRIEKLPREMLLLEQPGILVPPTLDQIEKEEKGNK